MTAPTQNSNPSITETAADGYGDARRVHPPAAAVLSPRNFLPWISGAAECWLFSRSIRNLLLGLPFLVSVLGLVSLFWWLRHASVDPILGQFEARFNQAVEANDFKTQEMCLNGLMQWRPSVPEYRLRLGVFLVEQGRIAAGLANILSLAPDDTDGYPPARMWLARQAKQDEPFLKLESDQIEGQLLRVIKLQPDNVDAQQMLAELYVDRQEWRLAEKYLVDAARSRPELNLAVAKLKQALKRPQQDALEYAERAELALTERLAANRFDVKTRVALVEAMLMRDKQVEARELLVAGVREGDGPEIRRALSDFDLMLAERRLKETAVNRDVALQLTRSALTTDPGNPRVATMLARLQTLGAALAPQEIQPAIDVWVKQLNGSETPAATRSLLSQLYAMGGQPQQAAEVLEPLLESQPDLRLRYAALLKQARRTEEAAAITDQLLKETLAETEAQPDDVVAAARYAEVLILARRLHEAAAFLRTRSDPSVNSRIPADPGLQYLYGMTCMELYDAAIADPSSSGDEDPFELLTDAVQIRTSSGQAVDRLVRIAFSDNPRAREAEQMVEQFRSSADSNGKVLSMLGLYALQAGEGARARRYLEQANAQARGRDLMILNNFAIALVRTDPPDPGRALVLVDQALSLSPDHPDLLSTRGEIYVAMERWAEAAADLKRSLVLRPNSVEVHRLLAQVYTALQEPVQAEFHRRRMQELQGS